MHSSRRLLLVAGAAAAFAVAAPSSAFAEPAKLYCLNSPGGIPCPETYDGDTVTKPFLTSTSAVSDQLKDDKNNHSVLGDEVLVEPGTYSGAVSFADQGSVAIFGDKNQATRPIFTDNSNAPTVTEGHNALGSSYTHLEIDHTGMPAAAFKAHGSYTLSDVVLNSTGGGIDSDDGPVTLTDVTANSTGPDVDTPLVNIGTFGTTKFTNLTVNAADRTTGMVVAGTTMNTTDHLKIVARGVSGGSGGYGLEVIGDNPTAASPVELDISHASIEGGSYGILADTSVVFIDNSLILSDGDAAPSDRKAAGVPSAGTAAVDAGQIGGGNVTVVAGGPDSVGAWVQSPLTDQDYASFTSFGNSIIRGGSKDIVSSPVGSPNFQVGRATLSFSNFRTAEGPANSIITDGGGDQTGDPLFVNGTPGANGDFHVKDGSPTLEAGDKVDSNTLDLDGNARPDRTGSKPDLGAYESKLHPAAVVGPVGGGGGGGGGTGGTGGTGNPTPQPQPIFAPSNAFSLGSATSAAKTGAIAIGVTAPGAGVFSVKGTTSIPGKKGKKKTVSFGSAKGTAKAAGKLTLTLKPSSAVKKQLKKKSLKVKLTITFTPNGGKPKSVTKSVTVKKLKK